MNTVLIDTGIAGCTAIALAMTLTLPPQLVHAACALNSTVGSDIQTCDSGSSGPLTNPGGNNTLIFPAGGTGSIIGEV